MLVQHLLVIQLVKTVTVMGMRPRHTLQVARRGTYSVCSGSFAASASHTASGRRGVDETRPPALLKTTRKNVRALTRALFHPPSPNYYQSTPVQLLLGFLVFRVTAFVVMNTLQIYSSSAKSFIATEFVFVSSTER